MTEEHTTQGDGVPSREPVYAGFLRRGIAAGIDVVLAGVMTAAVETIPIMESGARLHGTGVMFLHMDWALVIPLVAVIVPAIYGTAFVARYGGTPGKLFLGMRVVTNALGPVGLCRAFVRHLGSWLSLCTCGLGYLSAPFARGRRTLHDQIAGTVVILADRE